MNNPMFRAWNSKKKEWMFGYEKIGGFSLFGEAILMGEFPGVSLEELNDIVIMQYIGIKDKAGVPIYVGDYIIFRGLLDTPCKVEFSNATFVYNVYPKSNTRKDWDLHSFLNTTSDDWEVIGNPFSNPELEVK